MFDFRNNKGRCGVCGDPFDLPTPRPHEDGGQFGRGIITRHYISGQSIDVQVELINNRRGHFELELCPDTDCLDVILLNQTGSLESKFFVPQAEKPKEVFKLTYQLPDNFTCDHCVIRWKYVMGSHVWPCSNEDRKDPACGPQLEARACADIAINDEITPNEEQDEEEDEKVDLLAGIFQLDELDEEENKSWIATLHTFKSLLELKTNGTIVDPNIMAHKVIANDKVKTVAPNDLKGTDASAEEKNVTSGESTWNLPISTQDGLITQEPPFKVESNSDNNLEMASNLSSEIGPPQSQNNSVLKVPNSEAEPENHLEPIFKVKFDNENGSTAEPESTMDVRNVSLVETEALKVANETNSISHEGLSAQTDLYEGQWETNSTKPEPQVDEEDESQDSEAIPEVEPDTEGDLIRDQQLFSEAEPEAESEHPTPKTELEKEHENNSTDDATTFEPKLEQDGGADAEHDQKSEIKTELGLGNGQWDTIEPETSLERSPVSPTSELRDMGSSSTDGSTKEPFLEIVIDNDVDSSNETRNFTQLFPELVYHHYNNSEKREQDGLNLSQRALIFPRDNEIVSTTVVTKQLIFPEEKGISERTQEKKRKRKKKKIPPTNSQLTKKNDNNDENEFKHEKLTHAYSHARSCYGIIRTQIILGIAASLLLL